MVLTCIFYDICIQVKQSQNEMTRADAYAYFSCCSFDTYDVVKFLEAFVASGILLVFSGKNSLSGCVYNVCNVFSFLSPAILWFCGRGRKRLLFAQMFVC